MLESGGVWLDLWTMLRRIMLRRITSPVGRWFGMDRRRESASRTVHRNPSTLYQLHIPLTWDALLYIYTHGINKFKMGFGE